MKKLTPTTLLFVLVLFTGTSVKAQNTFPTGVGTNVGIGTTSPTSPLDIRTGGATPGGPSMSLSAVSASSQTTFWAGIGASATQNAGNTQGIAALGLTGIANNPAGTNVNIVFGTEIAALQSGAGTSTEIRGIDGSFQMGPTAGNVTNAECFYAHSIILNSPSTTGSITNGYGFFMAPFTSNVVNKYGFYINDATANNYLGGSMSIGTISVPAGYKMAVNGSAICTQMVVKTFPWSDYVFQKDYHLPSLDSVALYVKEHQHLSGIPSADEVAKNGVDVGATEAALLKKVEELTLYLIKQNDLLRAQQQEIDQLKKKGRKSGTPSN